MRARAQHARVGEVVDVLGGAAEVHQLEHGGRGAALRELLAHEIFHGLDVVVDARLDGLDRGRRVVARFEREARGELFAPVRSAVASSSCGHGFGQASSQAASMRTRSRIRPLSDSTARNPSAALRYRPSTGESAESAAESMKEMPRNRVLDWPRMISQGRHGSRKEHDSFGEIEVPAGALWGAQTERARRNFQLSGTHAAGGFHRRAGADQGRGGARQRAGWACCRPTWPSAIADAALDVARGAHDAQFPLDVYQTGSGTSTNMNVNEVIAHLASASARQAGASPTIT